MDSTEILAHLDSLPDDWKWRALFSVPEPVERVYRGWLAEAQQAEEQAVLRYWASRPGRGELEQAA